MPQNLVSIGHLIQNFQRSYTSIFQELTDKGVKPVLVLDLKPYFDFDDAYRALDKKPRMIEG